jgi:hypothetical protein
LPAFIRKILDILSPSGARNASGERFYLAAFGKHPAWDDHIDDIGLETERLAAAKRSLYVEGIGGNIDAGVWDELESKGQAHPFDHVFVWRWYEDTCVGRLSASRDGKGRTRYPLVVCAQCVGMALEQAIEEVAPRIERVGRQASATTSASALRTVVHSNLREIREMRDLADARGNRDPAHPGGSTPGESTASADSAASAALARIATAPDMLAASNLADPSEMHSSGPSDRRGLLSVLYQIEREMTEFRRDSSLTERLTRSRVIEPTVPPQPLRVPACSSNPLQAARLWMNFLYGQVHSMTPVLALLPAGQPWLDLVVGTPTVSQIYCVRASLQAMPLTTQIPYTLEPQFVARANAKIDEALRTSGAAVAGAGASGASAGFVSSLPRFPGSPNGN